MIPIGVGLIITGFLLVLAEKMGEGNRGIQQMNFRNAIFIGLVQGVAICPGISRSGSTLFGSLICNLDRKFAVKFVFLISIPSILGSAVLETPAAIEAGVTGCGAWSDFGRHAGRGSVRAGCHQDDDQNRFG